MSPVVEAEAEVEMEIETEAGAEVEAEAVDMEEVGEKVRRPATAAGRIGDSRPDRVPPPPPFLPPLAAAGPMAFPSSSSASSLYSQQTAGEDDRGRDRPERGAEQTRGSEGDVRRRRLSD